MAEASEAEVRKARTPAYALLRAAVAQDTDAAVLVVRQAEDAGQLRPLVFNMAYTAARAILAANAYHLADTLALVDGWLDTAANGAVGSGGQRGPAA